MIKHIRRWNFWRKFNGNSALYKTLVFFGIVKSPTFMHTLLPEEWEETEKSFFDRFKYVADETKMGKENNEFVYSILGLMFSDPCEYELDKKALMDYICERRPEFCKECGNYTSAECWKTFFEVYKEMKDEDLLV